MSVSVDALQAPNPLVYEYFGLQPPWQNNSQWMTTESGQFLFDRFTGPFFTLKMNVAPSPSILCQERAGIPYYILYPVCLPPCRSACCNRLFSIVNINFAGRGMPTSWSSSYFSMFTAVSSTTSCLVTRTPLSWRSCWQAKPAASKRCHSGFGTRYRQKWR